MKRLLLPLIAALAFPTAVNAESAWLIIRNGYGLEKIEMKDMDQCKSQGEAYMEAGKSFSGPTFVCLTGK